MEAMNEIPEHAWEYPEYERVEMKDLREGDKLLITAVNGTDTAIFNEVLDEDYGILGVTLSNGRLQDIGMYHIIKKL